MPEQASVKVWLIHFNIYHEFSHLSCIHALLFAFILNFHSFINLFHHFSFIHICLTDLHIAFHFTTSFSDAHITVLIVFIFHARICLLLINLSFTPHFAVITITHLPVAKIDSTGR